MGTLARGRHTIYLPAFEGMVALHRGEIDVALGHVAGDPESFKRWHDSAWRPWYAAVWAEAGVLAALPDRRDRLDRARFIVQANPIAAAIVERAVALDAGDHEALLARPWTWTLPAVSSSGPGPWSSPVDTHAPRARPSWRRSARARWRSPDRRR